MEAILETDVKQRKTSEQATLVHLRKSTMDCKLKNRPVQPLRFHAALLDTCFGVQRSRWLISANRGHFCSLKIRRPENDGGLPLSPEARVSLKFE